MRGLVFTAFFQSVQERFGLVMVDALQSNPELASGGAYTSVGNYDHGEMLTIIADLAERTGQPVEQLVQEFGEQLFPLLVEAAPAEVVQCYRSVFDFLEIVDDVIHVHVRKLDADAELPTFSTRRDGDHRLEMLYRSSRPFADLAEGLIRGCIKHFGESLSLRREPVDRAEGHAARFILERA